MEIRTTKVHGHETTPIRPRRIRWLIPGNGAPDGHQGPRRPARYTALTFIGFLMLGSLAGGLAWENFHRGAPLGRGPGQRVADFAIKDVRTGQVHRLSDHRGRVVVIIFTGTARPIDQQYFKRLHSLAKQFEDRDVDFLAINSNANEPADDVAQHARLAKVRFPVLKDLENHVADAMLAERTGEALLIDTSGRLRYRGAIDNQYAPGANRDLPVENYLTLAINAVLEGKPVSPEITQVFGRPIERTGPL